MNAIRKCGIILAIAAQFTVVVVPAQGEETDSYLCVADQTTGFTFAQGTWKSTNFKEDRKFLFKREIAPNNGTNWNSGDRIWTVSELGQVSSLAQCYDVINLSGGPVVLDNIFCGGLYNVKFNKKSLRLLLSYFVGFTDGDNNDNTPTITIGKCSKL
jgi:hypothetical protein